MEIHSELATRLEKTGRLPSPPRVAMQIIEAARDPDLCLADVADVVTADPVISAKIMRMANSAAYARRGGCETLRRALLTLGLDATLMVALSFTLALSLRRNRAHGLDQEYFWRRSLLAATAAASLAKVLQRNDGESIFLAALLQDIGMLALDQADPELYGQAADLQRDHRALADYEMERLGNDHADVSGWLLARWQLPSQLVDGVASSHHRRTVGDERFAECVAFSGLLADVWLASDWQLPFRELVGIAVDRLQLDDTQLGAVLEDLRNRVPETEAMFEKDLLDPAEGLRMIEDARDLIVERGIAALSRDLPEYTRAPAAPVTLLRLQHRAELNEVLTREFAAARRDGASVGVVLAGLDSLDYVREKHGADAADRLLREAARVMLLPVGARIVGQYSRNEIVLWLDDSDNAGTLFAGRQILRAFEGVLENFTDACGVKPSLALGVAALDRDHAYADLDALLAAAHEALRAARFGSLATPEDAPLPAHS